MRKIKTVGLKAVSLFFGVVSSMCQAANVDVLGGGTLLEDGDVVYPFYSKGIGFYDATKDRWFLDGVPVTMVGDNLVSDEINLHGNKQVLLDGFVSELGVSVSGDVSSNLVLIVDPTCPFSVNLAKQIRKNLTDEQLGLITFIPISRTMETAIINQSLSWQCGDPKRSGSELFNVLVDRLSIPFESPEEDCNIEKKLYGLSNFHSLYNFNEVPYLIVDGEHVVEPFRFFSL
ncbi:exported hypothetical protein [Vibrio chagasii]|nr:exported hypothetical protein [Vibrio chagasii]